MIILAVVTLSLTFADTVERYYAHKNTDALEQICLSPPGPEAGLLCRYRLYPLTEDNRYLENLPTSLDSSSAREYALLSGLWGYRAAQASLLRAIQYGRHSDRLLALAREINPQDPFVLLVEGQSLLFRPRIAGGNPVAALERFRQLKGVVAKTPGCGVSHMEADLWVWYAMTHTGSAEAPALREDLLRQGPPALYREFLNAPLRAG